MNFRVGAMTALGPVAVRKSADRDERRGFWGGFTLFRFPRLPFGPGFGSGLLCNQRSYLLKESSCWG
jgi:hypothetical protein